MNKFLIIDVEDEFTFTICGTEETLEEAKEFIKLDEEWVCTRKNLKIYQKVEKKQIPFHETFIEKIKEGKKIFTVRNKPIPLGIYSIDDEIKIEIIRCEKVEAYFHKYIGENSISFNCIGDLQRQGKSINTKFGFDKHSEMVDFYKGYLKDSFAYLMQFRLVS